MAIVAEVGSHRVRTGATFDIGAVAVAHPGEVVLGDLWTAELRGDGLWLIVADGLGHGAGANDASRAVLTAFAERRSSQSAQILEEIHRAVPRAARRRIALLRRRCVAFPGSTSAGDYGTRQPSSYLLQWGTLGHAAIRFMIQSSGEAVLIMLVTASIALAPTTTRAPRHPSIIAAVLSDFSFASCESNRRRGRRMTFRDAGDRPGT
jgi:hypothetical protein